MITTAYIMKAKSVLGSLKNARMKAGDKKNREIELFLYITIFSIKKLVKYRNNSISRENSFLKELTNKF